MIVASDFNYQVHHDLLFFLCTQHEGDSVIVVCNVALDVVNEKGAVQVTVKQFLRK